VLAALIALVPFAAVVVDHPDCLGLPTPLASEALGPMGKLQSREAFRLRPIGMDEFGEGKHILVLDSVLV
jgi:hypothetical protein